MDTNFFLEVWNSYFSILSHKALWLDRSSGFPMANTCIPTNNTYSSTSSLSSQSNKHTSATHSNTLQPKLETSSNTFTLSQLIGESNHSLQTTLEFTRYWSSLWFNTIFNTQNDSYKWHWSHTLDHFAHRIDLAPLSFSLLWINHICL